MGFSICFAKAKLDMQLKLLDMCFALDMFLRNEKRTDAEWHIRPILNVDISQQFMIF